VFLADSQVDADIGVDGVIAEDDVSCVASGGDEVVVVDVEVLADVDGDSVACDDLVFVCEIVVVGTADTGPPTHSGTADPGSVSRRPVSLSHVRRVEVFPLSWNSSAHPTTCMYTRLSCRTG